MEGSPPPASTAVTPSAATAHPSSSHGEDEKNSCGWPVEELLPAEMLCHILQALPKDSVAPASRTCRRWYACSPPGVRHKLSMRWACSSLAALQWVRLDQDCPLSANTCALAAAQGQLQVLQWAREHGFPWDESTCNAAAETGQLKVLQWARENGAPWDETTCTNAAAGGHLEVLQWARANGCPWDEDTCTLAAFNGHLEVLQWARENSCPWDALTCAYAAEGGHLDVLRWARANGCPWSADTCAQAAWGGHVEVLQWARANGCPWGEWTCAFAAAGGHLEVLKWARAQGCPWGEQYGVWQKEAFAWAKENGCPWSEHFLDVAIDLDLLDRYPLKVLQTYCTEEELAVRGKFNKTHFIRAILKYNDISDDDASEEEEQEERDEEGDEEKDEDEEEDEYEYEYDSEDEYDVEDEYDEAEEEVDLYTVPWLELPVELLREYCLMEQLSVPPNATRADLIQAILDSQYSKDSDDEEY
ncbi:Ankyrin repeat domain containing protein [Balamuthia mandrillaris]